MERTARYTARDYAGKFEGFRINVESVPRLPVFPAKWALEDPRRRAYLVFWESREERRFSYALRLEPGEAGGPGSRDFVRVSIQERDFVLWLERRQMPGGKTARLWVCPDCERSCRFLYLLRAVKRNDGTGFVRFPEFVCVRCSGLRWSSQGSYRNAFSRAISEEFGGLRDPLPREPWNPRAVSNPLLLRDEFPDYFGGKTA